MAGWNWQVSGAVVYFRATCVVLTTDSIIVKGGFRICPIGSGVSTYQQRWAKRPAILDLIQCTTRTYSKHNRSTVTTRTTAGLGLHFQNKKYRRYSSSGAANEGNAYQMQVYLAVIGLAVQHGNGGWMFKTSDSTCFRPMHQTSGPAGCSTPSGTAVVDYRQTAAMPRQRLGLVSCS